MYAHPARLAPALLLLGVSLCCSSCKSGSTETCGMCGGTGQGARGACTFCVGRGYREVSEGEAGRRNLAEENQRRIARGEEPLSPSESWWAWHWDRRWRYLGIAALVLLATWGGAAWKRSGGGQPPGGTPPGA
jgi:hypothetical protein